MVHSTSISLAGISTFRFGICLAICVASASSVQGHDAKLLNVQPATIKGGDIALFGVIREIPDYPFGEGTVLAVQITASESGATTESRRIAQGAPCVFCTTMHYFLVQKEHEKKPEVLYRTAPGPVTYIHINKKEYMVGSVELNWEADNPKLEKVTLLQTGFAPPLFKRRIHVQFDAPLEPGSRADEIADMALRDAFHYARPTTLQKVFPPEDLEEITSGSE